MNNKVLEKKISHWKQQLLDLSKRNRMINFKESRLSTLKLTAPDCTDLYHRIVDREEELSFKRVIDETSNSKVGAVISLLATLNEPIKVAVGDIGTNVSVTDMQKALKNLRSKAKLSLEEQGSNILYMCVGFIEWSGNKNNYKTKSVSPLILVPVTIQMSALNAPYTLKRYDDEVVLNPTLVYLFENELGYKLPDFDSDDDSIESYLDKVEKFADKQGWHLIREVSIGLMSFQKISMYMDIENNIERLRNNPVINALSGDSSMMNYSSVQLPEIDSIHPENDFEVLNADSSQQEAILCSKQGLSFVMQGPPGTGKSQTIANIISEALADNKKVLFVSEKMAALQVVYHRLQETNLADFCLPLHSYKANKKEVIDQLGRNLNLSRLELKREVDSIQELLFNTRNELNEYVRTLHKRSKPIGLTCYEIYIKLIELREADIIDFELPSADKIDRSTLYMYLRNLEKYEEAVANIGFNVKNNPWRDFEKKSVGIEYISGFLTTLNELNDIYAEIIPLTAELETVYHIDEEYLCGNFENVVDYLAKFSWSGDIPAEWFDLDNTDDLIDRVINLKADRSLMRELMSEIEIDFLPEIVDKDMGLWLNRFQSVISSIKNIAEVNDNDILMNADVLEEKNRELSVAISVMKESLERITQIYQVRFDDTLEGAEQAANFISITSKGNQYLRQWFEPSKIADRLNLAKKFSEYTDKAKRFINDYSDEWSNNVISADNGELLAKFCEKYSSGYLDNIVTQHLGITSGDISILRTNINELNAAVVDLIDCFKESDDKIGIKRKPDSEAISIFIELSEILKQDTSIIGEWFIAELDYAKLIEDTIKAEQLSNELFHQEEKILEGWEKEALDLDYNDMLHRFEVEYKSVFRFFKSIYREDRRNVRSLSKNDEKSRINDEIIVDLLNRLKERKNISDKFDELCIPKKLGHLYSGHETNWDNVRSGLKLAEKIHGLLGSVSEVFCGKICDPNRKAETVSLIKMLSDKMENDRIRIDKICKCCGINSFEDYSQLSYKVSAAFQAISDYDTEYEKDRTQICRYSRIENKYYSDEYIKNLLLAISDYRESMEAFSSKNEFLCNTFGTEYDGIETDWNSIISSLNDVSEIIEKFGLLPEKTIRILCDNSHREKREYLGTLSGSVNSAIVKFERNNYYSINKNIKKCNLALIAEDTVKIDSYLSNLTDLLEEITEYKNSTLCLTDLSKSVSKVVDYCNLRTICLKAEDYLKLYLSSITINDSSDLDELIRKLKLVSSLRNMTLPVDFYKVIASDHGKRMRLSEICQKLKTSAGDLSVKLDWVNEQFDNTEDLREMTYSRSYERIAQCLQYFDQLEFWIDFRKIRQECCETVLKNYIQKIEEDEQFDYIRDSFLRAYYLKVLDHTFSEEPVLSGFKRNRHEKVIENFRKNDEKQLMAAQARLCSKLIEQLPDSNSLIRVNDEVSILQKELNKRQKHMPLRKLFRRIPNLLMRLKPCLMMSPLSVSYFLEAESYNFDLVIFDEASQILPEDAIGAILRGKQVIIAGDIKQMPPTSFFSSSVGTSEKDFDVENEDEEDEVLAASILEEAAGTLPSKTLLWHYRSKNENLIAFSNSEIYDNKLVTFPNSTIFTKDMGVEYVYVSDGIYEGRGKNCNEKEAQQCVKLLEKHIIEHPERSLGIIAFSEKQQGVIQREVDNFRIANPKYEFFFENNSDEPFFVKNLENVQGDERDTIIFSICYAKDASGRLYMRFGPLGQQGGERRLNVAITRAKCNVKLVGSLLPEELDLNRIKADGVRLLRRYIEFAIHGESRLKQNRNIAAFNKDEFCDCVAEFISELGFSIKRDVGSSDNRIDIAVSDPDDPDSFIAGIECDGYMYKAAKTARDRDSLRFSMLNRMGWNMYRVWSTEWICNEKAAKKQLLDFLNKARNGIEDSERIIDHDISNLVEKVDKVQESVEEGNAYGLGKYTITPYGKLKPIRNIYDYSTISEDILCVLSYEQPISLNLLYRRITYAFGIEKMTAKYRTAISVTISRELKEKVILDKNEFLWVTPKKLPKPRVPSDAESLRKIEDISIEEIMELMKIVLLRAYGLESSDLIAECSAVFSYERRGARINTIMNDAIDKLKKDKVIEFVDGKINLIGG